MHKEWNLTCTQPLNTLSISILPSNLFSQGFSTEKERTTERGSLQTTFIHLRHLHVILPLLKARLTPCHHKRCFPSSFSCAALQKFGRFTFTPFVQVSEDPNSTCKLTGLYAWPVLRQDMQQHTNKVSERSLLSSTFGFSTRRPGIIPTASGGKR